MVDRSRPYSPIPSPEKEGGEPADMQPMTTSGRDWSTESSVDEVGRAMLDSLFPVGEAGCHNVFESWENSVEVSESADSFFAFIWLEAANDERALEMWHWIDRYYQAQMRHTIDAWVRRGKKRRETPPKNKWRNSKGDPNMYRKDRQ